MYSLFNRGVQCDIFSKDGASHVNTRATLSNERTVKENGGQTVCIQIFGSLCIYQMEFPFNIP
jgi:hypothetical protein